VPDPGAELRRVLGEPGCAIAVGAHDPVVARLVEEAGFPVCYVSGSASSACVAGFPDVGLLTFPELLAHAGHVVRATALPVLCDVDTGFGNTTNVQRTIRELEAAGVAGVHLEDQTFPKRCGQTAGATCIPVEEMCAKIVAAKESQRTAGFVLVARSDARQCEDLDALIERCRAYVTAGADAVFPEALLAPEEFVRVREAIDVPLVIDVPEWGRAPTITVDELTGWGFDLAIFAVSTLRVALQAVQEFLGDLHESGTQRPWLEQMMTRAELDALIGLTAVREAEERHLGAGEAIASGQRRA
jgi:methylisocitrate lyase